jgi:hypothetical protein
MTMDKDLLQPAATITVELLRRAKTSDGNLSDDVIASAFEQAYQALQQGIQRIDAEEQPKRV